MIQSLARIVDGAATEPIRVWAWLRLPMVGLMILRVSAGQIEHWLPLAYGTVIGLYAAAAVVWLVVVMRGPVPPWAGWVSIAIDVLAVLALSVLSGGATAAFLPLFFLLPIAAAFQERPALTAVLGIGTAIGYLVVWIIHSKRDDAVGLSNVVFVQFLFLFWLAVVTTALCYVLTRRAARVTALLNVRRRLVSESMQADDRHTSELAEQLHDGPLQNIIAARLELSDVLERISDPALDTVDAILRDTATGLRTAVTTLHPQVLAELGLTPAVRELIPQFERWFTIEAELEEVGRPASQSLLYRATRELLVNAHKHAQATRVRIALFEDDGRIILNVTDDGVGFDPAKLDRSVAEGHIGLGSLIVRIEAVDGSFRLESAAGRGTHASVAVPAGK
ncbi:MAG: sensor histidine kinase [Mycobacterium sp.]